MSGNRLIALMNGTEIGDVDRDRRARLTLTYRADWRTFSDAVPLSISMPLAIAEHGEARIQAFLWNLLPDNELTLQRWARQFHVSARNVFALLEHVGEDCAGAVQFVSPDRLDAFQSPHHAEIEWLDEGDVAERLRLLRRDHAAWRLPRDVGQFSLAGAQPKTALLYRDGRWGLPSGRVPTTHILKPPTGEFDGHVQNEHFCLTLARAVGLPTASAEIRWFEDEVAVVIERFDRFITQGAQTILRLHQEDACQALGLPPTRKYQNHGGPGPKQIVALLRTCSSTPAEDVATFVDALAFNWLIAGTDAHAKNYALLHGPGRVRLAPLYDVASALPYDDLDFQRLKLAMKIGKEYRLGDIGLRQWVTLAQDLRLDPDVTVGRVAKMATRLADQVPPVREGALGQGLAHPVVDRLAERIVQRAEHCRRLLPG